MINRLLEIWRFRELITNLARARMIIKYRWSVVGLLWSLLNPLILFFVFSVAFRYIVRIGLENYPLFLLSGLLPWIFFTGVLVASAGCLLQNSSLILKINVPREVFVLATIVFFLGQFLLTMLVFSPFPFFWKTEFTWINLLYFPAMALFIVFTIGICLGLSALTVLYRDVEHLTEFSLIVGFWITPIVYNFSLVPESWQPWFKINPLVLYMTCFHDLIYWNRIPDLQVLVGIFIWPIITFLVGCMIFRWIDPRITEEI